MLVFVDDDGAVSGRSLLIEVLLPFDNDGLVRDCFTREGGTRVITPTVGVEACNSTQTYTQMCLAKKSQMEERNRIERHMCICLYVFIAKRRRRRSRNKQQTREKALE